MSKLLLSDPKNDFENYESKVKLLEEYWKYRLKRKNFDSFIEQISESDGRREDVRIYKTDLINRAESIMLFCAMTSLNIIIDDRGEKREVSFVRKEKKYENKELEQLVKDILTLGERNKTQIRHYLLVQLFPLENNYENGNCITIKMDMFDIVTSWLLENTLANDKNIVSLLKCVSKDLINNIIAYVTRACEEDGGKALLWWFTKIYKNFDSSEDGIEGYEEWLIAWCKLYPDVNYELKQYMISTLNDFILTLLNKQEIYEKFYFFVGYLKNYFIIEQKEANIELLEQIKLEYYGKEDSKTIKKG